MKKLLQNLALMFGGIVIALLVLEAGLRLFPGKLNMYNSTLTYQSDAGTGYRYVAGGPYRSAMACYDVMVRTNALGFRDESWTGKPVDLAFLGDSFMAALEVPDGENLPALVGRLTGTSVMNTGISGYGTVVQELVFDRYVAPVTPGLVVLFFVDNDVWNNSCELTRRFTGSNPGACMEKKDGIWQTAPGTARAEPGRTRLKALTKKYCQICTAVYNMVRNPHLLEVGAPSAEELVFRNGAFLREPGREWQEAWEATDLALGRLQEKITQAGSELLVVPVPHSGDGALLEQVRAVVGPGDFHPQFAAQRLRTILEKHGIASLDLRDGYRRYRKRHNLPDPGLHYWCDGHWNSLGHFAGASLLAGQLAATGRLPVSAAERSSVKQAARENLRMAPGELLGEAALEEIFSPGGVFRGRTTLLERMELPGRRGLAH